METKTDALNWWRKKTLNEQLDLATKYHPLWSFHMVNQSKVIIERIYLKETGK